jgi:hypothetical protein
MQDVFLSRFAFIFLIYAVVTSGYINEILSCQMQHQLATSKYFRHILGVLLVFSFVMLEGGWSFDAATDELADNNWSSGHVLHTLVMAVAVYAVFIVSSKSRLVPNLIFFGLVLALYLVNTQRRYYKERNMITDEQDARLIAVSKALFVVAVAVLAYGFVDYVVYQKGEYGAAFRWSTFLLGASKCAGVRKGV